MSRLNQDSGKGFTVWKTAILRYGKGEPVELCHGSCHIKLHSEICVSEIWPSSNAKND